MAVVKLKKHSYNVLDVELREYIENGYKYIKFNPKHVKPGQNLYLTFDKSMDPINFQNSIRDVKSFEIKLKGITYIIDYIDGQTFLDYQRARIGFLFKIRSSVSKSDKLIQMIKKN